MAFTERRNTVLWSSSHPHRSSQHVPNQNRRKPQAADDCESVSGIGGSARQKGGGSSANDNAQDSFSSLASHQTQRKQNVARITTTKTGARTRSVPVLRVTQCRM